MVDTGSNFNIHYLQIFLSLIFFFCQLIASLYTQIKFYITFTSVLSKVKRIYNRFKNVDKKIAAVSSSSFNN